MAVLSEELTRDPTRAHDQAMQTSSHTTVTDTISTRFVTVEGTGDDRPWHQLLSVQPNILS